MATSTLNPNAPIFVPLSYRKVEDFSDEWWDLVRSSPYFRDYWLRECFSDPQNDNVLPDFNFSFPDFDVDQLFDPIPVLKEEVKKGNTDLVSAEVLKWQMGRMVAEMPKYAEKAPKIVKMKGGPRIIQQPR